VIEQRKEKLQNSGRTLAADATQIRDLLEPLSQIFQSKAAKQYALAVSSL
jgi:hypothetical protein